MCLDYGCLIDFHNSMLRIQNKTTKKISILYADSLSVNTKNNVAFYISDQRVILPDSTNTIFKNGNENAWHEYIEERPEKKLFLFVFSVDDLNKYNGYYTMDQLCDMHKYIKVLSFFEKQLIQSNLKVEFDK